MIEPENQNNKKTRSIIIKFVWYNCSWKIFLNKKKFKNTGISITESLTAKRMEMLINPKEQLGFRNVWTLDEKFYCLAEGCAKPQIFRNWLKVACLSYGKSLWHEFLFCVCIFIGTFSSGTIIVNKFSQVSLLICFHIMVHNITAFNILFWFEFYKHFINLSFFFFWGNFTISLILFILHFFTILNVI